MLAQRIGLDEARSASSPANPIDQRPVTRRDIEQGCARHMQQATIRHMGTGLAIGFQPPDLATIENVERGG